MVGRFAGQQTGVLKLFMLQCHSHPSQSVSLLSSPLLPLAYLSHVKQRFVLARLVAAQEAQRARSLHHGLGVVAREERGAHADCAAR